MTNIKGGIKMPRGDGTGPLGLGPRTGRGLGYCAGYNVPGYLNPIGAYWGWWGRGPGWGRGRGFRWMYYLTGLPGWARGWYGYVPPYPAYNPYNVNEKDILSAEAKYLEDQLKYIRERLDQLERKEDKKED